jgi:hypothetical protein
VLDAVEYDVWTVTADQFLCCLDSVCNDGGVVADQARKLLLSMDVDRLGKCSNGKDESAV